MKYTKTYEGFFQSEVPKTLIDSITGELSNSFELKVERPKINNDNILDRVKISCKTKVGPVDLVISLFRTKGTSRIKLLSKAAGMFKDNVLHFSCYHGKDRYAYTQISMGEINVKTGDLKVTGGVNRIENTLYGLPNNVSKYVEYTVNRVIKENKARKEFEDFYKKELIEEVKDLLIDLYDMLGEYKMVKKNVKGKKGFFIEFDNVPKEFIQSDEFERRFYFESSPKHMQLLNEIHNLYMRLKEGYGLTLDYNLQSGLKLIILQDDTSKNDLR